MSTLTNHAKLSPLYRHARRSFDMIATIVSRLSDIPNLCASILRPGPLYQDPSRVVHQWVNQLEREAGVGDGPNSTTSESTLVTGIAGPGPSTISRRNRESISSRCSFPDFFLGSYEDALRTAQADAVALCVILLSNEHDDVGYFIQYASAFYPISVGRLMICFFAIQEHTHR